jgi:hypothetical protein
MRSSAWPRVMLSNRPVSTHSWSFHGNGPRSSGSSMVVSVVRQIADTGGEGLPQQALILPILYLNILGWLFNLGKARSLERTRRAGLVGQTEDGWWHITHGT